MFITLFLLNSSWDSVSGLYTAAELRGFINNYVSEQKLVNPHEQRYVNVDTVLQTILTAKGQEPPEFAKRDELAGKLAKQMQAWHEITLHGKEPVRRLVFALAPNGLKWRIDGGACYSGKAA